VEKIDEDSRQLAEALANRGADHHHNVAEVPLRLAAVAEDGRGTAKAKAQPSADAQLRGHHRRGPQFPIRGDGHRPQGVLGGEAAADKARELALEEGEADMERLYRAMAKRGRQPNMSFFAFTATPKHKTLKVFGRDGEPFSRYTMRQAIEEGFIEDVLKHYVLQDLLRLLKACEDDPNVERKKAARALARFMRLHPHNIAQKTAVMVEHFQGFSRHKIGGRAKAMVVTGSRLEAVRYKQSFDDYISQEGLRNQDLGRLLRHRGRRQGRREDLHGVEMNSGLKEKDLPDAFATAAYQVLLVAEKYQTGFDQPLLHTMYVDKRLAGIQAVQTLSRLNRTHPLKEDTFVLDFVNDPDEIREAFKVYLRRCDHGRGGGTGTAL
jgi:type I restriction enzyme R subunit